MLGITVRGQKRFRVLSTKTQQSGLLIADVEFIEEEPEQDIPDQFYYMSELLEHVSNQKDAKEKERNFCDIVYQLIYLLPLDSTLKQQLLEVPQCLDRAVVLHAELIRLGVIQYVKPGEK